MRLVLLIWNAGICSSVVHSGLAINLPNTTYLPTDFAPDSIRTIINHLGFKYKNYSVVTEDGYVVNLNRIVNPHLKRKKDKGIPVLIVNGLFGHADGWFLHSDPALNPPVRWVLEGYDVWLGDQRGSIRSIKHKHLTVWDRQFWDFSFHEIGYYDIPAWIDFIVKKTGHKKVVYVGYSDGGAFYYVLTSSRPEYQDKLYGGILWAPVGQSPSLWSMTLPQRLMLLSIYFLLNLAADLGIYPVGLPVDEMLQIIRKITYGACKLVPIPVFQLMLKIFTGGGCQFEPERLCLQLATYFGGTSAKTTLHTLQLFQNGGVFRQYDYGWAENAYRYGQMTPPMYNISNLRVFTARYYSNIDIYAPTRVVKPFARNFSGPKCDRQVDNACHLYFIMDVRQKPFLDDATSVLDEITSRNSDEPISQVNNHFMKSMRHLNLEDFSRPPPKV